MNPSTLGRCLLVGVLLVACGDDEDTSSSGSICGKFASVGAALNCSDRPTDCAEQQAQTRAKSSACESQLDALNACLEVQPIASFTCGTGSQFGVVPRSGVCQAQFDAFFACGGGAL